jgi:MerR family transcriptional regulator, light-induced transcriptional regulator
MLYELGPRARRVYDQLLERIRSGELAPGTRLPAHTTLAETFGVAPLTVRQVLARLEADNILVRERGRGTFVRAGAAPQVLIVAADPAARTALADEVRRAGRAATLAATPAEGLAALARGTRPALVVVDLHLPAARHGLAFVRRLRQRERELLVAVFNPTPRQRSRLEHSVAPPLLAVGDPPLDQLSKVLEQELVDEPAADLVDRYLMLQLAGERRAARQLIVRDGVARGLSVADLYRGLLQPAQYRVGELWQNNQVSVAREHLATALTQSLVVEAAMAAPRADSNAISVLVACVEGELHDIGARMVAELLELDGFTVRFLGADVPTGSLVAMIVEDAPRLVILSATMAERLGHLEQAVIRIRQALGSQIAIFIGGQILDWLPNLPRTLDVDVAAEDALDTLEQARRRFSVP